VCSFVRETTSELESHDLTDLLFVGVENTDNAIRVVT
jgi:hypothetical protein